MKRLPYLYFHMKNLNDLQRDVKPEKTFYKLYCVALLVLGLCSLIIWKAESNYREGLKRSPGADSVESKAIPVRPKGAWEGSVVSDSGVEITETPRGISFTF